MSATIYFYNESNDGVDTSTEINMSNGNASAFMSVLGFDANFWDAPPIPVEEFIAACERFLTSEIAEYVDRGTPTVEQGGPGETKVIHCGRREWYFVEKVTLAVRSAREAHQKGAVRVSLC